MWMQIWKDSVLVKALDADKNGHGSRDEVAVQGAGRTCRRSSWLGFCCARCSQAARMGHAGKAPPMYVLG